ncbi:uracil phosphoribosyltransferase, partial [Lecanoromycetidae sp. Uapishka_2]
MASASLPSNIHMSSHPCLRAKLSQLRSKEASCRETKALVNDIALILGCEALASCLENIPSGTAETPLNYTYTTETTTPRIALVPILRSGLSMIEALQTLLPDPVPVHHLGLFREPTTLQPVEYYNNLPYHRPTSVNPDPFPIPSIAILLDPVIATGGTSSAAIQTLLEWGVKKVVLISVLGSKEGVKRAAEENGSENVELWVGGIDERINEKGMIVPGLGDVGDRLFLTIGK